MSYNAERQLHKSLCRSDGVVYFADISAVQTWDIMQAAEGCPHMELTELDEGIRWRSKCPVCYGKGDGCKNCNGTGRVYLRWGKSI
jgi:DnaJ-class molecular chaperone